jgi:Mce-associated membrane protein
VALVVLVVAGAAALRWWDGPRQQREQALHTAREFALAVSSYDYRHVDTDLARLRRLGIGNLGLQYAQVLGGPAVRNRIVENRAVATARIVSGPYLASLQRDEARTYTALEQTVTDTSSGQPQPHRVRVETILVRTPHGWKVDWVQII